jgi:hypothetical protein
VTFTTSSGSRYEVDAPGQRIRRLGGRTEPTPRQGIDGRWREYVEIGPVEVGLPVLVLWTHEPHLPGTVTSRVVTVQA